MNVLKPKMQSFFSWLDGSDFSGFLAELKKVPELPQTLSLITKHLAVRFTAGDDKLARRFLLLAGAVAQGGNPGG
jgi:hypothetical protein